MKTVKEDQSLNIHRLIALNSKKPISKYAKKGIFFKPAEVIYNKKIDLYNHGCPLEKWNINPATARNNPFQIFTTGDAFSVISPEIDLSGAQVTIHAGLEHPVYSGLTLIQEALQLCRSAYEHGARSISIALPDQLHPVLHVNDFNSLLLSLFKASVATNVYYYGKNYRGILDDNNLKESITLTFSGELNSDNYHIYKRELSDWLKLPEDHVPTLDERIMYFIREKHFQKKLAKFAPDNPESIALWTGESSVSEIQVPELQVPHVLLCCSSNKPLAEKIAESLRMRGENVKLYYIEGKGEYARIPDDAIVCGATVTLVQSTRPNPDCIESVKDYQNNGASAYFFEAALIARQAKFRGANTINLINPYQFGARSDKAEDNAKGKTGAYVQQNGALLEAAGINQVITAECHDNHTMSGAYTGKTIRGSALPALSLMSTALANEWMNNSTGGQLRLVVPDAGAAKRTKELTEQLKTVLGKKLCQARVLGEKQRNSHDSASAEISCLNSGNIEINAHDKYVITDDETATGNTLCQAVERLVANGAKDIAVVVVHNNMPLDWLERQLCLARFLYLGVNALHFSDTNEMGTLATSYDNLIISQAKRTDSNAAEVEMRVFTWFKDNISKQISDQSEKHLDQEFMRFKSMFNEFESKVCVHSLAGAFADKVTTMPSTNKEDIGNIPEISVENEKFRLFREPVANALCSQTTTEFRSATL